MAYNRITNIVNVNLCMRKMNLSFDDTSNIIIYKKCNFQLGIYIINNASAETPITSRMIPWRTNSPPPDVFGTSTIYLSFTCKMRYIIHTWDTCLPLLIRAIGMLEPSHATSGHTFWRGVVLERWYPRDISCEHMTTFYLFTRHMRITVWINGTRNHSCTCTNSIFTASQTMKFKPTRLL